MKSPPPLAREERLRDEPKKSACPAPEGKRKVLRMRACVAAVVSFDACFFSELPIFRDTGIPEVVRSCFPSQMQYRISTSRSFAHMPNAVANRANPNHSSHYLNGVRPLDWEASAAAKLRSKREAGAFELAANMAATRTHEEKLAMGQVMVMIERVARAVLGSNTHTRKAGSFLKHTYVVGLSDLDVCIESAQPMTCAQKKELTAAFKRELGASAAIEKNKTIKLITICGFVDVVPLTGEFLPGGINFEPKHTFRNNVEGQRVVRMLKVYAAKHSVDWSGFEVEREVLVLQRQLESGEAAPDLYRRALLSMRSAAGYEHDSSAGSLYNDGSSLDDSLSDAATIFFSVDDDDDMDSLPYFRAVAEHFITSIRARQALERVHHGINAAPGKLNALTRLNELKQVKPPIFVGLSFRDSECGYGDFVVDAMCTLARGRRIETEGRGPSKKAAKMAAAQRLLEHVALKPILPSDED